MRSTIALIGLSSWLFSSTLFAANMLENIRIWPAPDETRVVIDLSEQPVYNHFLITESKPFRLVVDLKDTNLSMSLPKKAVKSDILDLVRPSRPPEPGTFRLVFDLKEETLPRLFQLSPAGSFGHRIVIDLPHNGTPAANEKKPDVVAQKKTDKTTEKTAEKTIEKIAEKTPEQKVEKTPEKTAEKQVEKTPEKTAEKQVEKIPEKTAEKPAVVKTEKAVSAISDIELPFGNEDIVIAIDPGHGGNDPGAVGSKRRYEKYVTLAIARNMAKSINAVRGMKAVLTRDGDYFVGLNKRSEIARRFKAHFLISIHADGFDGPDPKGASVWVLSKNRANSEIGRWIERHEKQSELLGGGAIVRQYKDEHLSRALLDLQFSNSHKEGYDVAVEVLGELGRVTELHKPNPEFASLAVLKAPDIPSILVEAGFITNPEEEVLLFDSAYQEKIAHAVYRGVRGYFERFPPDGTLFAAMKNGVKHKVKDGESLSLIAEKYRTTVEDLMRVNNLSSEMLVTNQELIIYSQNKEKNIPNAIEVGIKHVVQYGEYLGKIANNYGVSIKQIRDINSLVSDRIDIGQVLNIPGI